MTDEVRGILEGAGMDVDSALDRFMNSEAMMEKFLKKFRLDPSYSDLCKAVEEGNCDDAFRAAHTLKGVAANFSFEDLRKVVADQTEDFRAKDFETGRDKMPNVKAEYNRVCQALTSLYGEV